MKLHELRIPEGSRRKRTRVGRGPGSGKGKTATRGHKGQKARSGGSIPPWFEGGQMPLQRRIPKRGFRKPNRKIWAIVNLIDLNRLTSDDEVGPETLLKAGLVKGRFDGIAILGNGELERALHIKAHRFSRSAAAKIENAGGKVEVIRS